MSAYLRAHAVTLELPLDLQRVDEGAALTGFRATMGGTSRMYRNVLKNVSFSAEEGDRIGLLGFNGAGKTTLLRVLNGAFEPTQGRVERRGTTQSLLNATLGFSEYASVMENVILRGTAMGLRRRQIEAALPDILDFAGLGEQAMHRLHVLSSGQRMRLGFAISTAVQPDILLMDEWIATGDAGFINRAQERLKTRFNDSRIVVLASHSTALLRQMCSRLMLLDAGSVRYFGPVEDGLAVYADMVSSAGAEYKAGIAAADPLLFGDALGMVEKVMVTAGKIRISGWAASVKNREVDSLVVEAGGVSTTFESFRRVAREDVALYLGRSGEFGFSIDVDAVDGGCFSQDTGVQVMVGREKGRAATPLPRAPSAQVTYLGEDEAAALFSREHV